MANTKAKRHASATQQGLHRHFSATTPEQKHHEIQHEFDALAHNIKTKNKQKRSQARQNKSTKGARRPCCILSQNVRGFKEDTRQQWYQALRQRIDGTFPSILFLQETHVGDKREADMLTSDYARHWGYTTSQVNATPTTYWTTASSTAGGVAVLIVPTKEVQDVRPWKESKWSQHWMGLELRIQHRPYTLINVYGPNGKSKREPFYEQLSKLLEDAPHPLIMGGDFNCTLHLEDRSHDSTKEHHSDQLLALLSTRGLVDVATMYVPNGVDAARIRRQLHTFTYTGPSDEERTARLDRWYVSELPTSIQATADIVAPGQVSDHDGVNLTLTDLTTTGTTKIQRRLYEATGALGQLMDDVASELLDKARTDFLECERPAQLNRQWDGIKEGLRLLFISCRRHWKKKTRNTYRTKLRELNKALRRSKVESDSAHEQHSSHQSRQGLRRQIASLRGGRAKQQQAATFRKYQGRGPDATKALHDRFKPTRTDATVVGLAAYPNLKGIGLATAIQSEWTSIMTKQATSETAINRWLHETHVRHQLSPEQQDHLLAPIHDAEMRRSLRKCKWTKACGPDRIPNDFYRRNQSQILPFLTHLANISLQHGTVPESFLHAHISAIPKKTVPETGLDFRPIALLNSDYKVVTRLLAHRLRPMLPELIHPRQTGFVPGRNIHDTIQLIEHAKKQAKSDGQTEARVLQLDYQKAYDSLDRRFLQAVLASMAFPPAFIDFVSALHDDTTAAFKVNGFLAAPMIVSSGIRQGCPLAPQLFILAMQPLYERLQNHPELQGVQHQGGALKIAGFADDTSIYIGTPTEQSVAMSELQQFSAVSGLDINQQKTTVTRLTWNGTDWKDGFKLARPDEHTRYLGVPIATRWNRSSIWRDLRAGIQTRLGLATHKTCSVLQRVELVNSIAVPKILFVGRHAWPTAKELAATQKLLHCFIWRGQFDGGPTKAKFCPQAAAKPLAQGGIKYPIIKDLLMATVARAEARSRPHLDHVIQTERKATSLTAKLESSAKTTAQACIRRYAANPRTPHELSCIQAAWQAVRNGDGPSWHEHKEWICVHVNDWQSYLEPTRLEQEKVHGHLNCNWLQALQVTTGHNIMLADGITLTKTHIRSVAATYTRLGDIVEFRRINSNTTQWRSKHSGSNRSARQHNDLMQLIIGVLINYPGLMVTKHSEGTLTVVGKSNEHWRLNYSAQPPSIQRLTPQHDWYTISQQYDLDGLETAVRKLHGSHHSVGSHPRISNVMQLFTGTQPPGATLKALLHWIRKPIEASSQHPDHAKTKQAKDSTHAQPQLPATFPWMKLHRHPTQTASSRWLWIQLLQRRLSVWDNKQRQPGCPHAPCQGLRISYGHVFQSCPWAQQLWTMLGHRWETPTVPGRENQLAEQALKWEPPTISGSMWDQLDHQNGAVDTDDALRAIYDIWMGDITALVAVLWLGRCAALHRDPPTIWQLKHNLQARWMTLQAAHGATHNRLLVNAVYQALHVEEIPQALAVTDRKLLLFFDGGSRGNPGHGGAGTVIVEVHHTTTLLWVGQTYGGAKTTNNQMEATALLIGLTAMRDMGNADRHVIGDSNLILSQHREQRVPKNPHLRVLYDTTRRLADRQRVTKWLHHYREHNKMADAVANMAMDSRAFYAGGPSLQHEAVRQAMASDMIPWVASHALAYEQEQRSRR